LLLASTGDRIEKASKLKLIINAGVGR